jgi:hypothetical protein
VTSGPVIQCGMKTATIIAHAARVRDVAHSCTAAATKDEGMLALMRTIERCGPHAACAPDPSGARRAPWLVGVAAMNDHLLE